MKQKRIAILTHAFGACTFPVVKRLVLLGYMVDFYEICQDRITEFECFESEPIQTKWGVNIINPEWYHGLGEYMGSAKLNYYYSRTSRPYSRIPIVRNFAAMRIKHQIKDLCRFIDERKYDCVLGVGAYNNAYYMYAYSFLSTPMVMLLHEVINHFNPNYDLPSPLMKHIFNNKLDVIVPSQNTANQLLKYKCANKEKVHIANFGVSEINLYISNKHLHDSLNDFVLFLGHILPYKGANVLYDAIVSHPDCLNGKKLVLAGKGGDDIVNKFKMLPNVVVINNFMPVTEMVELIQKSHVLVMPYLTASQSGIPLAAYAFGKPIVATCIPSLMDFVKNEENGLLCKVDDAEDLAHQLWRITSDKDLYDKLCLHVNRFEQDYPDFSWDVSTKIIAGVLEKIQNIKMIKS